jgi:uncharacterized membrane protein (UPF0127 family)
VCREIFRRNEACRGKTLFFLKSDPVKKVCFFRFFLCLTFFTCSLSGCGQRSPEACIKKKDGAMVCVAVETVRTQSQRQLGLMYRRHLAHDAGMLFFFDSESKQAFTMKNTYIPLDIIFIGRDRRIVGWVENAAPLTDGPYGVERPSQYVLEVNGFFCRQHTIAVGDTVLFDTLQ